MSGFRLLLLAACKQSNKSLALETVQKMTVTLKKMTESTNPTSKVKPALLEPSLRLSLISSLIELLLEARVVIVALVGPLV